MAENTNQNLSILRVQIEYYLSDTNLAADEFFHSKISEDSEGYVDVNLFLNCNKVKKLNVTKDDIVNAIKTSEDLELNSTGDKVRRKGNKSLPELKLLKKKQKRRDSEDEKDNEPEEEKADNASFDPIILEIKSNKDTEIRWKNIQDEFALLNSHLTVSYMRFKTHSGHIGVFNKSVQEFKFNDKFTIEGVEFTVTRAEGDNLIHFWRDHGSHFEMCIGRTKKMGKGDKGRKDINFLKNSVTLGNEVYTDVSKIKARARMILHSKKDGEKVVSPDHEFLLDILKFHRNFNEKSKNLDYFTTDKPSDFQYSRCFFIVRKDGSRDDFSVHKCIERLKNENGKRKK
jgi:hypothetical protein